MKFNCVLFCLFLGIELAGCKNNDNVFPIQQSSFIKIVNTSVDTLNIYLNGTRQNNLSNLFPGGSLDYFTVPTGVQNYQFKKAGSFSVLFNVNLSLTYNTYNTLFVSGESASLTFNTLDNLPQASNSVASDTAYIRFVNTSSDAGNLNASVGNTVKLNGVAYKNTSTFLPVIAGQNEVKISQGNSAVVIKDTTLTIQANYVYTLVTRGLINGTGNTAFNVSLLTN